MYKICLLITAFLTIITISSCSKKNHPSATTAKTSADSIAVTKGVKKRVVTTVPKVITVNDKVAKRSVDGRYYYDLNGRRYWRNNKDGKYYLFNRSMFDDEAFKATGN